ncbi:cell division protein FtsQ [Eikenella longinqua]|uniref:Cell division protein FtsQ n=1 Tax=Eikenella longinqua TaxID=1795827 RepID=A0A1A9S261_9NEIS|nr:FtsQ-type POTRA domain-containing protein [Eikenella longinqua]OAM30880.1 cell division protein FtsQ [Eikenella longinqua]
MRLWDNAGALKRINSSLYLLAGIGLVAAAVMWMMNSPYFPVKLVKIDGQLQRLSAAQLQQTASQHIRGNIFKADLNEARQAFEALPWVAKAEVRRLWPDTVQIQVVERKPVARWEGGGLVDSEGKGFDAPSDENFPIFAGTPGMRKIMVDEFAEFQAILAPTGQSISRMDYSPRSSRVLTLGNGIQLHLGRNEASMRLRRFVQAWHEILKDRAADIRYVDLRYRDGFAVRYRQGADNEGNDNENDNETTPRNQAAD